MSFKRIAIIGGGFLGLTLALRLAETGAKVTVYESAPEIGGLAGAWQIGDAVWDKHYHVTLLSDSNTRRIVEEIGLADEFQWVETKTGFYTGARLISMSNAIEFLKFPPLGLFSKFRLGATIFYASRLKNWRALEKITVEDWLTKLSGRKTFETIWKPLLKAKLGLAYKETSAAFIWATIHRMYAARKSGLKKEMFGYVRGGYAKVLKKFGEVLLEKGVEIRLNSSVGKIEKVGVGLRICLAESGKAALTGSTEDPAAPTFSEAKNESDSFDQVILTCPPNIAARILPQLSDAEKARLASIKYLGIVCASVLTKKSLSGFYVTNIIDEAPFTGIIEMSALVDKKEFGGNALVYLPKYVAPDDKLFEKTDAEVEEIFLAALEKMFSHFKRADVVEFKVSRVRQVFPLPTLSYSDGIPPAETSIENVFLVNSSQITNGTLNINETVNLAENAFERICGKSDQV